MNIKASIIIITYNQENTIRTAIESVLSQRYSWPYEIVIGDDGSTDGTRGVCEEYAARYPDKVRLMKAAPNKGIVGNYFDCLAACRGEYVADCAGDDCWCDWNRLQMQSDYLDTHPEDVAVISDWEIEKSGQMTETRDKDEFAVFRRHISGREMMMRALGSKGVFPLLSAMLFRREVVRKILESEPDRIRRNDWRCEDLPLIVALGSVGDFGYLSVKACRYSINAGGVSNVYSSGKLFDFYIHACGCVLDLCCIYGVSQNEVSVALNERLKYLGNLALEAGDTRRCHEYVEMCRRIDSLGLKPRFYSTALRTAPGRKILRTIKSLDL